MNVPTFGAWLSAAAPILLLILLLAKLQWGAAKAAVLVVAVDIVIALTVFHANPLGIAVEGIKGIWSSLGILIIVWPAILLYEVTYEARAFRVIREGMKKISPNELLRILAIGFVFVGFLQGITGFGVPVAVCAPLLIGMGLTPFWAVVISLLGQSWGNTFGTLSAAWDALATQGELVPGTPHFGETAFWAALMLFLLNIAVGLLICWFYGKGTALKKGLPAVLLLSLVQGGGELLLSQVNTTLCCFIPCCAAFLALFLLGRTPLYNQPWQLEQSPMMQRDKSETAEEPLPDGMNLSQAFSPYLVLSGLTLVCLLVAPVKKALTAVSVGLSLPALSAGSFTSEPVTHYSPINLTNAGFFLLASGIFGILYCRSRGWLQKGAAQAALKRSLKKTLPSAASIIAFLILANIMSGTGQTMALAGGFAAVMGPYYSVLAALVGMLGSFLTGSNMSSNILFCNFQMTTASLTGLQTAPILAAQTAGGSIGSMISPSKIVLGATTAGILGEEGRILKKLIPIALAAAALIGIGILLASLLPST